MSDMTHNQLTNRLSEHLTFTVTTSGTTEKTLHLVTPDTFQHVKQERNVATTLTLTGKRTNRALRLTMRDVEEPAVYAAFAERIARALPGELPTDEESLLDALADYFDEDLSSPHDAPSDTLIVLLNEGNQIVDIVGRPDEEDRRYILVRLAGNDAVGVIPVTAPMNFNIENRAKLLEMFGMMAKDAAERNTGSEDA